MRKNKLMKKSKTKHKNVNKDFIEKESQKINTDDTKKLFRKQKRLKKILNLKAFSTQKEKFKLLLEILKQYHKGDYKDIPWRSIAAITFTLLYIINPADMVPDVLPVIGYVDDISVFMGLFKLIEKDIDDYETWKVEESDIQE